MKPYRCPICGGCGIVPGAFYNATGISYTSSTMTEQCRACGGTGIIWGSEQSVVIDVMGSNHIVAEALQDGQTDSAQAGEGGYDE